MLVGVSIIEMDVWHGVYYLVSIFSIQFVICLSLICFLRYIAVYIKYLFLLNWNPQGRRQRNRPKDIWKRS